MFTKPVAVLGGGNGAQCMAADLVLSGFEAVLYEHPKFRAALEKVLTTGQIELRGVKHEGVAELKKVTLDMGEALAEAELINVVIPALGHELFFQELVPHLRAGQTVVVWAGDFGSLRLAKLIADQRPGLDVTIAEAHTLPYGTRIAAPGVVELLLTAPTVGIATLPAGGTDKLVEALAPMWPEVVAMDNVLACALANPNPVCHPPGSILNTGRIQYSGGDFYMYGEGITEAVARVIRAVFLETVALAEALGVEVFQYEDRDFRTRTSIMGTAFQAPFDTIGVIGDIIGPKTIHDRYITEDLPFGLVPMSELGDKLGVATPLIDSFVHLGSTICEEDYWKTGRTLESLGVANMNREELLSLVNGE